MKRAWADGQEAVFNGTHKMVSRVANVSTLSYGEAQNTIRMMLSAADKTRLARRILADLADEFEKKGDFNVANTIRHHSKERTYGD